MFFLALNLNILHGWHCILASSRRGICLRFLVWRRLDPAHLTLFEGFPGGHVHGRLGALVRPVLGHEAAVCSGGYVDLLLKLATFISPLSIEARILRL
jgi:hypothetical protein